jgi:hypothetical protein
MTLVFKAHESILALLPEHFGGFEGCEVHDDFRV